MSSDLVFEMKTHSGRSLIRSQIGNLRGPRLYFYKRVNMY